MQVHIDISAWPSEEGYVTTGLSAALGSNQIDQSELCISRSMLTRKTALSCLSKQEMLLTIWIHLVVIVISFHCNCTSLHHFPINYAQVLALDMSTYVILQSHPIGQCSCLCLTSFERAIRLAQALVDVRSKSHFIGSWSIWRHIDSEPCIKRTILSELLSRQLISENGGCSSFSEKRFDDQSEST